MKVSNLLGVVLAAFPCGFVAETFTTNNDVAASIDGFVDEDVVPSTLRRHFDEAANPTADGDISTSTLKGGKDTGGKQENSILRLRSNNFKKRNKPETAESVSKAIVTKHPHAKKYSGPELNDHSNFGKFPSLTSHRKVLTATQDPSQIPSSLPSETPSYQPSETPSSSPSGAPSLQPSSAPSSLPSDSPSETPSARIPSFAPSISNSPSLSSIPSSSPTSTASETPSISAEPSVTSSKNPSSIPSSAPSLQPSLDPTLTQTSEPSLSFNPSTSPSISFSPSVSSSPTVPERPSTSPSAMPSDIPSSQPSAIPSSSPSTIPSDSPSLIVPSSSPSISNSPSVSSSPSFSPSTNPSEAPSVSYEPTISSSDSPSYSPTSTPSVNPSISPSVSLSPSVTSSPSWPEIPSTEPSAMPSDVPTLQPSSSPSSLPSTSPSEFPSFIHPSSSPSISNLPSFSSMPSSPPTMTMSETPSLSSEPTSTLSDSPSSEPSASSNPSSTPSISFLPSSSPSSQPSLEPTPQESAKPSTSTKPTSKCKSDFRSVSNWARQNYIVAHYRISSDSGEVVLNGELLQKDCTTPITDTSITASLIKNDYMSGGEHIYFFSFMYDLDQRTIKDSVVFNERRSQLEVCHIVTLGCGSKKNKRIMRIPVRRSRFGSLFGDPHITTFDGLQYDCQAAGEFTTLTSLQDPTFKIQERFTAVESTCGQASVSTGVAFRDTGKPILQVSKRRSGGALNVVNGCPMDFYVDGTSSSIADTDLSSSNVNVTIESDRVRLKHTDSTLSLDVIVRRSNSFGCHIMVQITLPGSFHYGETLLGLMGTPNDNRNDDWRAPDGTELLPPATDADSLFSTAYSYCVENWCIDDATDSLFSYEPGESFEDISGCAIPFSNEVEVAVNNILDDPSSNQALSDACEGSLACLVDGVCGDISDAVSALEIEQEIATTQEEAATSVFPLEETEVTDVEEITINEDPEVVEVTTGTGGGGTGTETETKDIYWYPEWDDKGSSKSVCLNDGKAPDYMKRTGLFLETSREACCQRFFQWNKVKCMGEDAVKVTPAGYYPNWGFPENKCLNSITQIGEENSLPDYMASNPHAWLYNDIESCCKKYYYWDLNSCIVESGGVSSIEFSNKWYVNQDEEICQQDCQEDVSFPTCGGPVESSNALYETASLCCMHKLSWVPPAFCAQQSLVQPVTGSGKWFVDWVLLKCVKDCESGENCGKFAKVYDMLYDDIDMCCSKLFWKARSECT